jgi:hypothetical protein
MFFAKQRDKGKTSRLTPNTIRVKIFESYEKFRLVGRGSKSLLQLLGAPKPLSQPKYVKLQQFCCSVLLFPVYGKIEQAVKTLKKR